LGAGGEGTNGKKVEVKGKRMDKEVLGRVSKKSRITGRLMNEDRHRHRKNVHRGEKWNRPEIRWPDKDE